MGPRCFGAATFLCAFLDLVEIGQLPSDIHAVLAHGVLARRMVAVLTVAHAHLGQVEGGGVLELFLETAGRSDSLLSCFQFGFTIQTNLITQI